MYEDQTFEAILTRCLARVPSTVDKREGSIIYDAMAPACAEIAQMYIELSTLLDRAFPDTATGEDLDRKCAERSITRKAASASVRKGVFTDSSGAVMVVPVGTRFSGGDVNYAVTEALEAGGCRLTAETAGAAGNVFFGALLPIDEVIGLAGAELADVLIPGEDAESDDSLRTRYFNSYDDQSFGGNMADYKERIGALAGVGGVKVFRAPAGGGTVGVTIVDSHWGIPSTELVAAVQEAVDPVSDQGGGGGFAPIGHTVTVSGVTGKTINISFTLTLENNVSWSNVQSAVTAAISSYFQSLIEAWADSTAITVRISQIETRVLAVPGILDVENTTLNAGTANLQLESTEIPVLGEVSNGTA
ncbi:Baseplate J-like protein [anaerobic digester metagenome]